MKRLEISGKGQPSVNVETHGAGSRSRVSVLASRLLDAVLSAAKSGGRVAAVSALLGGAAVGCASSEEFPGTDGGPDAAQTDTVSRPDAVQLDSVARSDAVTKDGGVDSVVSQPSCDFTTRAGFLVDVVTTSNVPTRQLAKEGQRVRLDSQEYTTTVSETGALLFVAESARVTDSTDIPRTGRVTIDVANRVVRLEEPGQSPRSYSNLNVVGLSSLSQQARYVEYANYVPRAVLTLTAGGTTQRTLVEDGQTSSLANGSFGMSARFVDGSNGEAVLELSGGAPGLSVAPDLVSVPEGGIRGYPATSPVVSVRVESVTDEYDPVSRASADRCMEYSATIVFNDGTMARDMRMVEGETFNINGRTVRVLMVQYDESSARRYVTLETTAGSETSTIVLSLGQAVDLNGGGLPTQAMLVEVNQTPLRAPAPPETDAGVLPPIADGGVDARVH